MINIGIIGYKRGIKIINILKKKKINFNVVAIYDKDIAKLKLIKDKNIKIFRNENSFFNYKYIDAVYIASPVSHHVSHSTKAAKKGIHILCEVPAFQKIAEGKKLNNLIKAKKITYMMAENYCYAPQNIALKRSIKKGEFGYITYIRSSYIHDCKDLSFSKKNGKLTWRGLERKKFNGNDYPTHSIGPVAKFLNIGQFNSEKFSSIHSFGTKEISMSNIYSKFFPKKKIKFKRPDISFSFLKTNKERLIEIICDTSSNRPSSMMDMYIQGTKKIYISGRYDDEKSIVSSHTNFRNSNFKKFNYSYYLTINEKKDLKILKRDFGLFKVLENFHKSIENKTKPYVNINDAFLWSSIIELSRKSIIKKKRVNFINL